MLHSQIRSHSHRSQLQWPARSLQYRGPIGNPKIPRRGDREEQCDDAFADLDAGRADFVIGVFDGPPKRFLVRPLIQDRFVVIAPKSLGLTGELTLDNYLSIPHILFTLRDDAQGAVDEALAKLGKKRRVALTAGHLLAVPALVVETGFLATISVKIAERLAPLEVCQIFDPPLALEPWVRKLIWTPEADSNPILRLVLDEITAAEDLETKDV